MIAACFRSPAAELQPNKAKREHAQGALAAAKRPRKKTDVTHKGAVGNQPRSSRTARLIPEYKDIMALAVADDEIALVTKLLEANKGWTSKSIQLKGGSIPPKARILKDKGDDGQGCSPPGVDCCLVWRQRHQKGKKSGVSVIESSAHLQSL